MQRIMDLAVHRDEALRGVRRPHKGIHHPRRRRRAVLKLRVSAHRAWVRALMSTSASACLRRRVSEFARARARAVENPNATRELGGSVVVCVCGDFDHSRVQRSGARVRRVFHHLVWRRRRRRTRASGRYKAFDCGVRPMGSGRGLLRLCASAHARTCHPPARARICHPLILRACRAKAQGCGRRARPFNAFSVIEYDALWRVGLLVYRFMVPCGIRVVYTRTFGR